MGRQRMENLGGAGGLSCVSQIARHGAVWPFHGHRRRIKKKYLCGMQIEMFFICQASCGMNAIATDAFDKS